MAATLPTTVPPVKQNKQIKMESLDKYTMADTGGNPYDRQNCYYGKKDGDDDDDNRPNLLGPYA